MLFFGCKYTNKWRKCTEFSALFNENCTLFSAIFVNHIKIAQKHADNRCLLLYQHILILVAVEPQTDVSTSFLENLQESFLHLRIEEKLAILCLVETALAEGSVYVQISGIARWDGIAEPLAQH